MNTSLHWLLRRWTSVKRAMPARKKDVLFYLGMHRGREFDLICDGYRKCYGFEANPELFSELVRKYRDRPHVELVHAALCSADGPVDLNLSSNDGASSSIGSFHPQWQHAGQIGVTGTVTVPGMNLYEFCRRRGIEYIDDYVSDIQGMDLEVLRTMGPYIRARRIGAITAEVTVTGKPNIYANLPDNSEAAFDRLLGDDYRLVATGYGVLCDYWFGSPQTGAWEIDKKWRRRLGGRRRIDASFGNGATRA